jgi:hypothetical protein
LVRSPLGARAAGCGRLVLRQASRSPVLSPKRWISSGASRVGRIQEHHKPTRVQGTTVRLTDAVQASAVAGPSQTPETDRRYEALCWRRSICISSGPRSLDPADRRSSRSASRRRGDVGDLASQVGAQAFSRARRLSRPVKVDHLLRRLRKCPTLVGLRPSMRGRARRMYGSGLSVASVRITSVNFLAATAPAAATRRAAVGRDGATAPPNQSGERGRDVEVAKAEGRIRVAAPQHRPPHLAVVRRRVQQRSRPPDNHHPA